MWRTTWGRGDGRRGEACGTRWAYGECGIMPGAGGRWGGVRFLVCVASWVVVLSLARWAVARGGCRAPLTSLSD